MRKRLKKKKAKEEEGTEILIEIVRQEARAFYARAAENIAADRLGIPRKPHKENLLDFFEYTIKPDGAMR